MKIQWMSDLIEEDNVEEYNEVSVALENTTTEAEDFEDGFIKI